MGRPGISLGLLSPKGYRQGSQAKEGWNRAAREHGTLVYDLSGEDILAELRIKPMS